MFHVKRHGSIYSIDEIAVIVSSIADKLGSDPSLTLKLESSC